MRQEGTQSGNVSQVTGNGPGNGNNGVSNGLNGMMGDSNNLTHQTSLDDMHQHIHSQTSQTLNFGDIY